MNIEETLLTTLYKLASNPDEFAAKVNWQKFGITYSRLTQGFGKSATELLIALAKADAKANGRDPSEAASQMAKVIRKTLEEKGL